MSIAVVTGSSGLIGSEAVRFMAAKGLRVIGIDNNLRPYFFGSDSDTEWNRRLLEREVRGYEHVSADIRDTEAMNAVFRRYGRDVSLIVHAAAQPSHDWAAREPLTDFGINALGTLVLLECARLHCPDAVFIFMSTNKVYGDWPNHLPLIEQEHRWDIDPSHPFAEHGIDESMSIDRTTHSVFGASKVAADTMVQEYGRYFGLRTASFRGGCLTGPAHAGAELHGFLSYLVKCGVAGRSYTVFGYHGKQVRDSIHARDLVSAFWHFFQAPRAGEVYNIGGGRSANCSIREAIALVETLTSRPMEWTYSASNRKGDHLWWISDVRRFMTHYPGWTPEYDLPRIMREMVDAELERREVS